MIEPRRRAIEPFDCLSQGYRIVASDYWLFVGLAAVVLVLSYATVGVLLGPLMCGMHMCLTGKLRGERPSFDRLFKGFEHIGPSIIATLVVMGPYWAIQGVLYVVFMVVTMGAASSGAAEPPLELWIPIYAAICVVGLIAGIFLFALLVAYPLVVDRGASGIEALKAGVKAVFAHFGGFFVLWLVNGIVLFVGFALCIVPGFLFLPIAMASVDVAYRKLFPEPSGEELRKAEVDLEAETGWGSA